MKTNKKTTFIQSGISNKSVTEERAQTVVMLSRKAPINSMEKGNSFLTNGVGTARQSLTKKKKKKNLDHHHPPYTSINLRWSLDCTAFSGKIERIPS